jgi:tetratricopeptide (TPR) repeat protein
VKRISLFLYLFLTTIIVRPQSKAPDDDKYWHYQRLLKLDNDSIKCSKLISYGGKISDSLNDYNFAFLVFEKTNALLEKKKLRTLIPALYTRWGYCHHLNANYETAEKLYSKALKFNDILNADSILKTDLLIKAGLNLEKLGFYQRAMACYNEALELCTKSNDEKGKVRVYSNMALIFTLTDHITQADELFDKAAGICIEKKWPEMHAVVLANKAIVKLRLKKYKEARSLFRNVLELDLRKNIKVYINTCFNAGVVYSDLKQWDSCFYFLNRGKAVSDSLNMSQQYDGHYYLIMGRCYTDKNDITKAIAYHKLALKTKAYITNHNYRIMYENISQLYLKLKQYDSAFHYKNEIMRIMDGIQKSELKEHVSFENKKIELIEKDYQSQIQVAQKQRFMDNLKKRNFMLLCIASTLTILILFLFFLYFKQRKLSSKKEQLQSELSFLKAQLNPHFLLNALNNIYVLLDKDKNKAMTLLVQFCELMRYQLFDCDVSAVPLGKEIKFIENYINFEKFRYGNKINVEHDFKGLVSKDLHIAPILLQPFIENAFKHTPKSHNDPGRIDIRMELAGTHFFMEVKNPVGSLDCSTLPGGIGLENVKKRLQLLYPSKHKLKISTTRSCFQVQLKITLSN